MTRVLIVEDQSMPRTLFEMYVNQSENYTLAGSISNADMTDYHCENSDVDLILMDICTSMGANGLEAAERIKAKFPKIKIIIVTSMPEYSYLKRAKEAGVDSFWYKEVSPEPIIELMDRTMNGDTNTEIAKRLYIAPGTVKNYIQYMLEKTGFKSRTELAVKAREAGLVILDDRINDK